MKNIKTQQTQRDREIYEISTMVAGGFKLREVLDRLAKAAVKITGTKACSIRLLDHDQGKLAMRSTYGLSEEYRNKGKVSREDAVIKAAFEGDAVVLDDMRVDGRVKYPKAAAKEGLVSQLTVAMKFKDDPIGVLRLYGSQPSLFHEDAVAIARLVASQCAVAITNAKLYRKAIEGSQMAEQMRLAGIVQRRMIPETAPKMAGLDISALYKPCFQIGGDFYDFIQIDENTIAIAIADVIGKGVPAAIMMSMFRGTLRAYADGGYGRHTLGEIVDKLNKVACKECRNGEFITLFLAQINVKTMEITYCNCGHEPAILFRDGEISELNKGGLVLGIMDDAEYQIEKIRLLPADQVFMYTDGLIDAMDFDGNLWGEKRFIEAIKKCKCDNCSADQIVQNVIRYRRRFVGLASQTDDTSIVAIKIEAEDGI